MPDYSAAYQVVVLPAPACVNIEVRNTGIKIADLGPYA